MELSNVGADFSVRCPKLLANYYLLFKLNCVLWQQNSFETFVVVSCKGNLIKYSLHQTTLLTCEREAIQCLLLSSPHKNTSKSAWLCKWWNISDNKVKAGWGKDVHDGFIEKKCKGKQLAADLNCKCDKTWPSLSKTVWLHGDLQQLSLYKTEWWWWWWEATVAQDVHIHFCFCN